MSAQFYDGLDPQDEGKKAKAAHVWERAENEGPPQAPSAGPALALSQRAIGEAGAHA